MLLCPWENPQYFIFSSNVPDILYYSHIPAIIIAMLLGGFIFFHNKTLIAKSLLTLLFLFSLYTLFDLVIWASNRTDLVLFLWSLQILLEPFIFLFGLYFAYFFLGQKIVPLPTKIMSFVLVIPFVLLIPTQYNIVGARLATCDAVEGFVALYYSYALEAFLTLWIMVLGVKAYRRAQEGNDKKRILLFTVGLLSLLLAFSWGNIVGSFTENWVMAQYGLFGMPVFIALLVFLIVRYQAFNLKLLGAQALIIALIALIGSQFFFIKTTMNFVLTGITLVLASFFGWFLVKSVKQEVKRKEELQALTQELATANHELKRLDAAKSEFISIASHQLRTPLTAIRGYISLVLEGSYGKVIPTVQDVLNKIYIVNNRMGQLVEDLLSISRIESGRVQYNFVSTQLEPIVAETVDLFALMAKTKHLALKIKLPKRTLPKLMLDVSKIREVISNLIDNAIKYTKEGSVTVSIEGDDDRIMVKVADTGIGVNQADAAHLFEKFTRSSETAKLDVSGTGLGLYVGKNFVEAHGGIITVVSDGPGKGACFIITFPVKQQKLAQK